MIFLNSDMRIEHECTICLGSVVFPAMLMDCEHVFCRACISRWYRQQRSCPICRRKITSIIGGTTKQVVKHDILVSPIHCNRTVGPRTSQNAPEKKNGSSFACPPTIHERTPKVKVYTNAHKKQ